MPQRRCHDSIRQPLRRVWTSTEREGCIRIDEACLSDNQLRMLVRRIRRSRRGERVSVEIHTADKNGNLP